MFLCRVASESTGFNHNLLSFCSFDGIVVCSEFEQVLIEAWEQQREEMEKQIAVV